MGYEDWDRRLADDRNVQEAANARDAEKLNLRQNHCCLGVFVLYILFVFVAAGTQALRDAGEPRPFTTAASAATEGAGRNRIYHPVLGTMSAQASARPSTDTNVQPRAASASDSSTDVQQYLSGVASGLQGTRTALDNLRSVASDAARDKTIVRNETWRTDAADALVQIRDSADSLATLYPVPPAMKRVQKNVEHTAVFCRKLAADFAVAADTGDVTAMRRLLTQVNPAQTMIDACGKFADRSSHTSG